MTAQEIEAAQSQIAALRTWSFRLSWLMIIIPFIGALLGGTAGAIRRYVDRREKLLSGKLTQGLLQNARADLESTRADLAIVREETSLAESATVSQRAYMQLFEFSNRHPESETAKERIKQLQSDLSIYETPIPYAQASLLVKVGDRDVSTGVTQVSVKDLFANLAETHITPERRRKLMAHLVSRIDKPDTKQSVLQEAHKILTTSDNLPAMAATCGILHWLVRGNPDDRRGWILDFQRWTKFAEQQLAAF